MPDMTNQATRVYPPLAQTMTEALQNHFTRRTKLEMARTNDADMIIEVVITNYNLDFYLSYYYRPFSIPAAKKKKSH